MRYKRITYVSGLDYRIQYNTIVLWCLVFNIVFHNHYVVNYGKIKFLRNLSWENNIFRYYNYLRSRETRDPRHVSSSPPPLLFWAGPYLSRYWKSILVRTILRPFLTFSIYAAEWRAIRVILYVRHCALDRCAARGVARTNGFSAVKKTTRREKK